jgi:hypothetical protein
MSDGERFEGNARALEAHLAGVVARGGDARLGRVLAFVAEARTSEEDDAAIRHLDEAAATLRDWSAATGAGQPAEELLRWVEGLRRVALDRVGVPAAVQPGVPPPPRRMAASCGWPQLHRGVSMTASPRSLPSRKFGALSEPPEVAETRRRTRAQVDRWAASELEEIAAMGSLRALRDDDPWTAARSMEARLLASLDGVVSLAREGTADAVDLGAACHDYLRGFPVPDRGRTFAHAFVLGCIDSRRSLGHLLVACRSASAAARPSLVDALCLASGPAVAELADTLLDEDDAPGLLAIALEVLARRGIDGGPSVVDLFVHPDVDVARRAIIASRWVAADDRGPALVRALQGPPDVALEAALALTAARSPYGVARLRAMAAEPSPGLATATLNALAIASRPKEAAEVLELAARAGASGLEALGWLGHPSALAILVDALADPDPAASDAARWSLARITGRGLEAWSSDGVAPPLDRAQWKRWLDATSLPSADRVRQGRPLDPAATLAELRAPRTLQKTRRTLLLELSVTRGGAWLDLDDWIERQLAAIEGLRSSAGDPNAPVDRRRGGAA